MLKQVVLSVNGANPFRDLAPKYDCTMSVVDCKNFNSHGMSLLIEIEGGKTEELIHDLKTTKGVKRAYYARNSGNRALVMVILETPLYCQVAQESGIFCASCPFRFCSSTIPEQANEGTKWKLLIRDANGLKKVIDTLEKGGVQVELKEISNAFHNDMLTPRQREILIAAIRMGHFDFPRKVDLTQLSKELSVKPSTLSEILRRAEAKIAKYYIESVRA